MLTITIVDASAGQRPATVEVAVETATVGELRALALSLDLPSAHTVLDTGRALLVCHDGTLLGDDDDVLLSDLGIQDCPVVVVLAAQPPAAPAPKPAAARPTHADLPPAPRVPPSHGRRALASAAADPPLADAEPDADAGPPADAVCRICFGAAHEDGAGKLISPCLCLGSMKYVHVTCLNEWRAESANPRSFYSCDQCNYQYNVERTKYAAWLESTRAHRLAAALLLVLTILGFSLVLGPLGVPRLFYRLVAFHPAHPYHYPPQVAPLVARVWSWRCDWLVGGLLGVAVCGVATSLRDVWLANRHHSHSWIIGILTVLASNDTRIYRVFAVLGFFHSMRVAVIAVEKVAKVQLTRWGQMVLEVRR